MTKKRKRLKIVLFIIASPLLIYIVLFSYIYFHPTYFYPYTYNGTLQGDPRFNDIAKSKKEWDVKYVVEKWDDWKQNNNEEGKRFFFYYEVTDLEEKDRENKEDDPDNNIYIGEVQLEYIGKDVSILDNNNQTMEVSISYLGIDAITLKGRYDKSSGHLVDNAGNTLYILLPSNKFIPKNENLENYEAVCELLAYDMCFSGRMTADSLYDIMSIYI